MYELLVHDLFWEDTKQALTYYKGVSPEISERFSRILLETLTKVQLQPENYFNLSKKYRRIRLVKFPYQIIYSFKNNRITILELKHESSRSREYTKRGKDIL